MHHSKRFGCHVYPLLFLVVLAVPGLMAQNPTSSSSQAPAQTQAEPENPQQNQVRLAQEAQARIRRPPRAAHQRVIQDTYSHKFEVYGGGGYTRFRPGTSLQHINESAWNGGFTDYLRPRLGITADLRGYYGTAFITPNPYNIFKPSISEYSFMAGPAVSHCAQGALGCQWAGPGWRGQGQLQCQRRRVSRHPGRTLE